MKIKKNLLKKKVLN